VEIYNVWAAGRNYKEHAVEMKAPLPQKPVFFLKPGSAVTRTPTIQLPSWTEEVHHELEIVLQFNETLRIQAWGLALDLTERKIQDQLKEKKLPWTLSKCFTGSCPISNLQPLKSLSELENIDFELKINDQMRQKGNTSDMIFSFTELTQYATEHFPVKPNDLLLTGTPSGVGKIQAKDHLKAFVNGKLFFEWLVA